jgi:ligand-binding sensor domain-containing protein
MRCLFVITVVLGYASTAAAQSSTRDWRPEDRTVIGDFSQVTAIAAASDRVFIASPAALLIWNPQFQKWEGSFDPPDPSLLARVFTGVIDPLDNSLWLARSDGWVHYQPDLRLWDQGPVPQGIQAIAFDRDDPAAGLFLRSAQGWLLLPRGGLVASSARAPSRPLLPPTIEQAIRSNPTLQANSAAILSDNRLRNVRYTAVARAADNRGWYLGTSGIGALYLSDLSPLPERMTFGLPAPQVGAVFSWPGGVWAATNRNRITDASLTFVGEQLDNFHSLPGPSAIGPPFNQVRELAGQGRSVWAATDLGVARVQPPDGRLELISDVRGLPDRRVYSIVSRAGRITVGTAHGLARIGDSLQVERLAPSYSDPVYAVWPAGDSIWVGTPAGLLLSLPNYEGLVRPAGLESASLKGVVVDLAPLADTLVALTRDQLLWRDPGTRRWTLGPNLSALLGPLRRFVADGPGFWVAGDRGLGYARLGTPPVRPLREGDLPGAVNDVAVDDTFLWVATDGGLVRFRLDAIRP